MNTVAPWRDSGEFDPLAAVEGMRNDARFIVDESFNLELARGEVGCLRRIYRLVPMSLPRAALRYSIPHGELAGRRRPQ